MDVCVSTTAGGSSGGTTGSGGSSGSGGSTGSAAAVAFCKSFDGRLCDLTFQCTRAADQQDSNFISEYGASASDCKTLQTASYATKTASCTFNSSAATTCLAAFNAADCNTDLLSVAASTSCQMACAH